MKTININDDMLILDKSKVKAIIKEQAPQILATDAEQEIIAKKISSILMNAFDTDLSNILHELLIELIMSKLIFSACIKKEDKKQAENTQTHQNLLDLLKDIFENKGEEE